MKGVCECVCGSGKRMHIPLLRKVATPSIRSWSSGLTCFVHDIPSHSLNRVGQWRPWCETLCYPLRGPVTDVADAPK